MARLTQERVIEQFNVVHGNTYDYSRVSYVNSKTEVEIGCPKHEPFWQTPNHHKQGKGCPNCAESGFNPCAPGYLYVVWVITHTKKYFKVGITKDFDRRRKDLVQGTNSKLEVMYLQEFENGLLAQMLEREILDALKPYLTKDTPLASGNNETFELNGLDTLAALLPEATT